MRSLKPGVIRTISVLYAPVAFVHRKLLFFKLDLYRSTQNMSQISRLVYQANLRETELMLRYMGANLAENVYIETQCLIHNARKDFSNLTVGEQAYIGKECLLDLSAALKIGARSTIAMRAIILTHFNAGKSEASRHYPEQALPVVIEDEVYVGASAIILPGVTVGKGAMIAAGAVVTNNVEPGHVVGGIPARVLKTLE